MTLRATLLALLLCLSPLAHAERADRDKPLNLEADRATMDDAAKVQTLEGHVILIKGTLVIQADKVVITEDQYGFQKGIAYAGPKGLAHFRQKRDGLNQYVDGEAERIEYDTRTEVAEFFRRAWVRSGDDQFKGDYIWYDSVADKFMASSGGKPTANGSQPRVRAVIQPKVVQTAPVEIPAKTPTVQLQTAPKLSPASQQ